MRSGQSSRRSVSPWPPPRRELQSLAFWQCVAPGFVNRLLALRVQANRVHLLNADVFVRAEGLGVSQYAGVEILQRLYGLFPTLARRVGTGATECFHRHDRGRDAEVVEVGRLA